MKDVKVLSYDNASRLQEMILYYAERGYVLSGGINVCNRSVSNLKYSVLMVKL